MSIVSAEVQFSESFSVFSHLNAQNSEIYRRVLGTFVTAKERFQVHLRPDDVLGQLRRDAAVDAAEPTPGAAANPAAGATSATVPVPEDLSIEAVTAALDSLVGWGNLLASPDTGRVVQVEDFYRKRHLFQLSQAGEAAERALERFEETLGRRGALQSVALEDIAVTLHEFVTLIGAETPDLGKLHQTLAALTLRFTELADNASAFMASLQRTIDLTDTDEAAFVAYKSRLVDYLERFIQDLTVRGPQIATLLARADSAAVDRALRALAEREASDALVQVPDPGDAEHPVGPDALAESARHYAVWANRWEGLRSWFLSSHGRDSQAKLLRMAALAAIPALLDAVRAVNARRSGRSDRSTDYLRLAQWFQEAPDDDRHRLARAAFGLYSARHLTVDSATWAHWSDNAALVGAPWADAPAIEISPQLRRTGSYERKGRPNQVIDRSASRALIALQVREQAEQIAAARKRLATDGTVELSALAGLDSTAFGLFLTLLGDALVARPPEGGPIRTASTDGTMSIELTELPDAGFVALETERGTLWGPDHLVRITDLMEEDEDRPAGAHAADAADAEAESSTHGRADAEEAGDVQAGSPAHASHSRADADSDADADVDVFVEVS
ncbi:TIGR02677 family protein [Cryobacterium breve]|uniref:TIGR02677 family protein n=1 Tax=Cryobacterium breve TaxID=1259258 RepID=A0ABY7NF12_9MICO|nr:TIGR02677 family protein [Cryobacterium breve]WBM80875.1 TIGR02677 family protein [Cryobacterium breve]